MSFESWSKLHERYERQEWIDRPSIFAEQMRELLPLNGDLLDLGAGQGQDSRFFAENGLRVVSTDISEDALERSRSKTPDQLRDHMQWQQLGLSEPIRFDDASFDAVYAHMSLHYFDDATLHRIMCDIHRILRSGGMIALLVNTVRDPECGTGESVGHDTFRIHGVMKRFFSPETLRPFITEFEPVLLDVNGESYKDHAKGIHHLVRFVGRKV
ncbi:MAG: class I SAM-dependent methyltransferase [Candidatus Peribacteraceae bacterium]|jgi:SAM-dependent methyltransferase|nr:class I SAM-dependent methyltransferase [Candidatus Peribacteraceae bacterium]